MIIPIILLLSLGIVIILTSNQILAIEQSLFALIGLVFYLLLRRSDYRIFSIYIKFFYIVTIVVLLITLFLGIESRGAIRWISLGPFNLQPSEFSKPILILVLADFWAKNFPSWTNIFKSILLTAPISILIFRQPDLGTALTITFIWLSILIASNASILKLFLLSLFGFILVPLSWFSLLQYQKQRLISFLFPSQDPQGIGFQVIQSMIAVGSGGFLGRGLGRGTQSRLQFLPEFRTDFIFSFIAEELGLLGSIIVLSLYMITLLLCFKILSVVTDRFGELIVIGVISMLFFQITVNIGMNVGLLPITGITLPLLSYGGSSMITTLISLGLISSVSKFGSHRAMIDSSSV